MRVGFDLDGVLAKIDLRYYKTLETQQQIEKYLQGQEAYLNPKVFLSEEDAGVIVTGRSPVFRTITSIWLRQHAIELPTYLVGTTISGYLDTTAKWLSRNILAKSATLLKYGIDVYFEDDLEIVTALRKLNPATKIVSILGGRKE